MSSPYPHDTIRLDEDETASPVPDHTVATVYQEDHARITPANEAVRKAFYEIVVILKSDSAWNTHARQFIHIDERRSTNHSSHTSSSDIASDSDDAVVPRWTGHYRLNLAILPAKFINGWIIGAGRNKPTEADVDILLSINGRRDNVRTRHARVTYHRESRAPMFGALPKKSVLLNGQEIKEQAHVLSQHQGIVVGNLAYRLEFLPVDKTRYIEALDTIVSQSAWWSSGDHSSFDPTPSHNHFELHACQFQTPQAAGAYGVVSACLQISTGNLYAVKRVQRTARSFSSVNTGVTTMKQINKHPHVCELVDVFYSDGHEVSMGSSNVNDVYIIINPWASQSLADFAATGPAIDQLTLAYHQGAQGIRHLHRSDMIYRHIKPHNLLVSARAPLCVVVADFGHATSVSNVEANTDRRTNELQNHMKGTISYLPPEITALKDGTDMSGHWSKASDVFTYGIVGFELFHGIFSRSRVTHCVDQLVHRCVLDKLRPTSAMDDLLACMLQWRVCDRPTMDQVLLKSVWPSRETHISTTRKRNDEES